MSLNSRSYRECLSVEQLQSVGGGDYLDQTAHSDIEPVSDTRAGNGIFCCGAELASFALIARAETALAEKIGRHVFEIAEL